MTLTVGTDSYISIADADTYFGNVLFADSWTSAVVADKEKALKMATKKIDSQMIRGVKAVNTQTLQFPRALYSYSQHIYPIVVGVDVNNRVGWYVESEVQQEVKDATCEEAVAILKFGATAQKRAELQQQGVTSFSLGGLSESFNGGYTDYKLLSLQAKQFLAKYLGGQRVIV